MSERDKKVVLAGAIGVALIVLVGYVIIPATRSWSESRSQMNSSQDQVDSIRDRIRSQEETLKQRNLLARKVGSLFFSPLQIETEGSETTPPVTRGEPEIKPGAKSEDSESGAKERSSPEATPAQAAPSPPPTPGAAAPPSVPPAPPAGSTLASYVEQMGQKAGVTIKRVNPRRSTAGVRNKKYFHSVMLQVQVECQLQNLVTLLHSLEKGDRFVAIDQIQIRRDKTGGKMDVTLDLRSYESTSRRT